MAILNSGFLVENPMDLTEPLEKLIKVGFGLEREASVEEIEVELDDEEEEEDDNSGVQFDVDDFDEVIDLNAIDEEEQMQEEQVSDEL